MTELNMYPTWSFVRIKATYTNRIPSGGVSYASFRHFVLLKKYIVYGQGPIACSHAVDVIILMDRVERKPDVHCSCMRTSKAQTSLHIRAVLSAPLLFAPRKV